MDKTVLPVISKEQLMEMNKMPSDEFVKSCEKAGRLFDNKRTKHRKAERKIDEIRLYLNNNLHPLVSPNNWQVYSDLVDMIDELGELLSNE